MCSVQVLVIWLISVAERVREIFFFDGQQAVTLYRFRVTVS